MLNEAPRLLAAFDGRYRIMLEDFWRVEFPAGEYDGVVASFALHHGRGEAVYLDLYRKIYDWLKVRGSLSAVMSSRAMPRPWPR